MNFQPREWCGGRGAGGGVLVEWWGVGGGGDVNGGSGVDNSGSGGTLILLENVLLYTSIAVFLYFPHGFLFKKFFFFVSFHGRRSDNGGHYFTLRVTVTAHLPYRNSDEEFII